MNKLIIEQLAKEFKRMIEEVMVKERERDLKENRETRANGYYLRSPKTILGQMELEIPRTRDSGFKPSILPERKRVTFLLDDIIRAMFIAGVSARKTGKVLEELLQTSISASFISSAVDIADEVIEKFKTRKLDYYPVVYIDATYIPLKRNSLDKEALYVVLGLRVDGRRGILRYYLPGGEEKASVWKDVFNDLRKRGLKQPELIISDDLAGIESAIKEVFPAAEHGLCWFHLKRNLKNRVRKRHWDEILKELNQIMDCKDEKEGKEKMRLFVEKWRRIYRSISNLKNKIDNYTHFLKFPNKIRSYFSTTNWMERLSKELKDYTRIRGYFQSEKSADKFLYLFFSQKNEKYLSRRLRYSDILMEVFRK